mmetsp:Transcript_106068/g.265658  ORF Transcript_106068/g.265658 Transcript_106068/m.265658 type:complete len:204 (-) Transcript_106068:11-622(-)
MRTSCVQRREAVAVGPAEVRIALQEQLSDPQVVPRARHVQRRLPDLRAQLVAVDRRVDGRAVPQQGLRAPRVALCARRVQGGPAIGLGRISVRPAVQQKLQDTLVAAPRGRMQRRLPRRRGPADVRARAHEVPHGLGVTLRGRGIQQGGGAVFIEFLEGAAEGLELDQGLGLPVLGCQPEGVHHPIQGPWCLELLLGRQNQLP